MRSFASLRRAGFAALRRRGKLHSRPTLLLYRLRASDRRRAEAGITVGTRVGKAVLRNTVRRRIGEILHEALSGTPGWQVLVVARPAAAGASFQNLRSDVRSALELDRPQ
jgi:ribonuclease P protein component